MLFSFFRTQIHDLHSGDHRPDVYASLNCCTEQPSSILITILPIQPLCLMNFMQQSGRRFAKVFPAYQLLQVHCWGGKDPEKYWMLGTRVVTVIILIDKAVIEKPFCLGGCPAFFLNFTIRLLGQHQRLCRRRPAGQRAIHGARAGSQEMPRIVGI